MVDSMEIDYAVEYILSVQISNPKQSTCTNVTD